MVEVNRDDRGRVALSTCVSFDSAADAWSLQCLPGFVGTAQELGIVDDGDGALHRARDRRDVELVVIAGDLGKAAEQLRQDDAGNIGGHKSIFDDQDTEGHALKSGSRNERKDSDRQSPGEPQGSKGMP